MVYKRWKLRKVIYRGKVIWERKKEIVFMPKGRGLRVGIVKGGKWLVFKF